MADRSILTRMLERCLGTLLPASLTSLVVLELGMRKARLEARATRRRFRGRRDLLVNIGTGTSGKEGWVNLDAFPCEGVNCVWDCRIGLPFEDCSARGIFTEHFLEHIDYRSEAPLLIRECRRVLRDGGVIRIVVPDAERYLRAYATDAGWNEFEKIRPLHAGAIDFFTGERYRARMELINHVFRQDGHHKYAYDYETLANLLIVCGFERVARQEFGRSFDANVMIDMPLRASESLYVEAVK